MVDGRCVKCGAAEVYLNTRHLGLLSRGRMALGHTDQVSLDEYVCVTCGYVETYLANLEDRETLKRTLRKVPAVALDSRIEECPEC